MILLRSVAFPFEVRVLFPIDFSELISKLFPQPCGSFVAQDMMSCDCSKENFVEISCAKSTVLKGS